MILSLVTLAAIVAVIAAIIAIFRKTVSVRKDRRRAARRRRGIAWSKSWAWLYGTPRAKRLSDHRTPERED